MTGPVTEPVIGPAIGPVRGARALTVRALRYRRVGSGGSATPSLNVYGVDTEATGSGGSLGVSVGTGSNAAEVRTRSHLGLTGAGALLLMFVVAAACGAVDEFTGPGGLRRTFSAGLVVAAALGAMTVRRRSLWVVVITPPLLYVLVSFLGTFTAPAGVFDSSSKLGAALVGWLVYGFPEIAASTGLAAVVAGIRLARRPRS